jgi:hypothetical protein
MLFLPINASVRLLSGSMLLITPAARVPLNHARLSCRNPGGVQPDTPHERAGKRGMISAVPFLF